MECLGFCLDGSECGETLTDKNKWSWKVKCQQMDFSSLSQVPLLLNPSSLSEILPLENEKPHYHFGECISPVIYPLPFFLNLLLLLWYLWLWGVCRADCRHYHWLKVAWETFYICPGVTDCSLWPKYPCSLELQVKRSPWMVLWVMY